MYSFFMQKCRKKGVLVCGSRPERGAAPKAATAGRHWPQGGAERGG